MNIENATNTFVQKMQTKVNEHYATYFDTLSAPLLTIQKATRFFKVWNYEKVKGTNAYRKASIVAFIDKKTGDIFKPANIKAPANHARGNVLSEYNGLEAVSANGNHIRYHNEESLVG